MDYGQMGPDGYPQSSLPWQERRRHSSGFAAFVKTIPAVLLKPSDAFSHIQVDRSLGGSMLYVVILGTVGGVFSALWQLLVQTSMPMPAMPMPMGPNERQLIATYMLMMRRFMVVGIIMTPFTVLIVSLIKALIFHACLWLVGGARQSFEATYAVVAYASGSTALFSMVPGCGRIVGTIWDLVISIIGLARVHECSTGRAVLAVLLPVILCCGATVFLFTSLIAMVVAGAAH